MNQRKSDTVAFKVGLVVLGVLLSFAMWLGQCAIMDVQSQEEALHNLDKRVTRCETIIPEIKESLCEIKKDLKVLLRK